MSLRFLFELRAFITASLILFFSAVGGCVTIGDSEVETSTFWSVSSSSVSSSLESSDPGESGVGGS